MSADILFLAHRIPFPPDRGDKIRSWHILKHLAGLGRVHLACFADDEADAAHLPALRAALGGALGEAHVEIRRTGRAVAGARALVEGKPVSLTLFDSVDLRAFVDRLLASGRIATVFAFSGQMAQFAPDPCPARFVMDFVDMDSAKFASYAEEESGPMRWVHRREAEAALFRARTGLAGIAALSNGIDLDSFDPRADFTPLDTAEAGQGPILLFTGQMDYPPNVDAVRWFAQRVLPHVPGRFVIAGRNPTAEVRALAGPRVHVTGAVPDMRAWLAAADIVVAPLRIARGIQNKVREAMAMAKPVVASPEAFEGIEAEPGRDLIVAEGAEAMAAAINDLLAAPEAAARLGESARKLVETGYSWDSRLAPLAGIVAAQGRKAAA